MSRIKKAPVNKKNDESKVTISVKYPSKLKNKNIVGDFAKFVKAILPKNPKGLLMLLSDQNLYERTS